VPPTDKDTNARRTHFGPKLSGSGTLAKIIGITNAQALSPNQVREFRDVVVPGVSNFIAVLQQHGVSRFDQLIVGLENFVSLHDPKPGNIWDLKLYGNNGREYAVRFNQTKEMGIIAALTNVVSFFPVSGPSVQGMMDSLTHRAPDLEAAVHVQPRSEAPSQARARNLSRALLTTLGNNTEDFIEISTTTEQAGGMAGGYITAFRPKGLDRPDNALYDATFGFVAQGDRLILDTMTYNSARLLPPHRQRVPASRLAVPKL
jgi:hypothetical protein